MEDVDDDELLPNDDDELLPKEDDELLPKDDDELLPNDETDDDADDNEVDVDDAELPDDSSCGSQQINTLSNPAGIHSIGSPTPLLRMI